MPKTQRFIEERSPSCKCLFSTRNFSTGKLIGRSFPTAAQFSGLKDKGVSNVNAALTNALEFTAELVERLRNGNKIDAKEVA